MSSRPASANISVSFTVVRLLALAIIVSFNLT